MLDYNKDRLFYGDLLQPPEGFSLSRAIVTTYSLDLITLLSIPVALYYKKNLEGMVSEQRMDVFDAINKSADKIKVYCQKGKIKLPAINRLVSFIEDCVVEILPETGHESFHPKVWIIRYINKQKKVLYRVLVLSRNLTFDRCWDVAFSIEGYVTKRKQSASYPLIDFVNYLKGIEDFEDSQCFVEELATTEFLISDPFVGFSFHPFGRSFNNPFEDEQWQELLVVSPFIDRDTLIKLSKKTPGKKYLFSRKEELDKIELEVLNLYDTYCFSNEIVDGESCEFKAEIGNTSMNMAVTDEGEDMPMLQNLHAKLYVGTTEKGVSTWYLGSMNCSKAAWERNLEFMIGLKSKSSVSGVNSIVQLLLRQEKNCVVFQQYSRAIIKPAVSTEYDFRRHENMLLRFLSSTDNLIVTCLPDEQMNCFQIQLSIGEHKQFEAEDIQIFIRPYGYEGEYRRLTAPATYVFGNIPICHLTRFLSIKIRHIVLEQEKEFITKIKVAMPENRDQEIFKSIIQNQQRFIQLIQFLLGGGGGNESFCANDKSAGNGRAGQWIWETNMYEELLLASSRNSGKLVEIENLIQRLHKMGAADLIPEKFSVVWKTFREIIPHG